MACQCQNEWRWKIIVSIMFKVCQRECVKIIASTVKMKEWLLEREQPLELPNEVILKKRIQDWRNL
jgi:hypothetical protein